MKEEISIYIPVFNGEKTIKACLESVFEQTLKPKQILVINDNSNDSTLEILKSFREKIEIISNSSNKGISFSRNLAVNHLKTRYIASIDADVVLSKNWIEQIINSLKKNNATLVGGRLYEKFIENPFNLWRSIRLRQHWGDNNLLNPKFVFGCNNILDTKKILNIKELYKNEDEYFKLNGDDTELGKFLIKHGHTMYYDSMAACHHLQDDNGLSLTKRYWRYLHYGDGLKKRNFFKTLKNLIRQIKKTFIWTFIDLFKFNFKLVLVNFVILYYFIILDTKFYLKK